MNSPAKLDLTPKWEFTSDAVMGGVSRGRVDHETVDGRMAACLRGHVSLDNNGGFIQMAFDLSTAAPTQDISTWQGLEIDVLGNAETYDVRLRTDELTRPWQSYRTDFYAMDTWQTLSFAFSTFAPHRTDTPLDYRRLRRVGLLAIGRIFDADVAVSGVRLFK